MSRVVPCAGCTLLSTDTTWTLHRANPLTSSLHVTSLSWTLLQHHHYPVLTSDRFFIRGRTDHHLSYTVKTSLLVPIHKHTELLVASRPASMPAGVRFKSLYQSCFTELNQSKLSKHAQSSLSLFLVRLTDAQSAQDYISTVMLCTHARS